MPREMQGDLFRLADAPLADGDAPVDLLPAARRFARERGWTCKGLARRALLVGDAWVALLSDAHGRERELTIDDLRAEAA